MGRKELLENVKQLLEPILTANELTLFDLQFVHERGDHFLRIYIDKEGGVTLEECSLVSEQLSEKLDETDLIKGKYYLDISSPGAERPLKTRNDFVNHIGENIFVSLYIHIDGEKKYEGILKEFTNDLVTIEYRYRHTKRTVEIPFDKIAKARLAVML